ncbi:hypothetical protein [Legionella parisiensis]|uniref:hypothetical protein n=1 Tax=Legionella parisiensis TaxID=45071 RepID=UPI000B039D6C|nr:hypothetical protein [Legionella parisiensis]
MVAHKKKLPYELTEQIGSYLDVKTASMVAQTSIHSAKQAKEVLDTVADFMW